MSTYNFKTTKIKGKDYVEVNERIKFFRQEDQYKNWSIQTEFPMLTADEALCRCTIANADGLVVAQGHAHESKSNGMINKTSYVENCETSAVGRALAMLGIGIDTSIASANEVETAIAQQSATPKTFKQEISTAKKEVQDDKFQDAITYMKSVAKPERKKALDAVLTKYGGTFSENQVAALNKFL